MPIRSRGELPDPCITAIRDEYTRPESLNIDTNDYIELSMVNTPECRLYFTTDESVPAPFQRFIGGREVTFRYKAPFSLKSGKRVVRAVAVTRDGLLSSRVVSKTFIVHGDDYDSCDSSDLSVAGDWSDACWHTNSRKDFGSRGRWSTCKSWHSEGGKFRTVARPVSADRGWIASTRRYPYNLELQGEEPTDRQTKSRGYPRVQIPDGPFNPVNYSGTQVNVWGGPPPSVWIPAMHSMATHNGVAAIGSRRQRLPTVQHELLTKDLIENSAVSSGNRENDDSRPLTVADVHRILAESETDAAASETDLKTQKSTTGKGSIHRSSPNVSFSSLSRSGKALMSSYHSKKK